MEETLATEGYPEILAILLCQDVSQSLGKVPLFNLLGIFYDIDVREEISLSDNPLYLGFWAFFSMKVERPEEEYSMTVEVLDPSGDVVSSGEVKLGSGEKYGVSSSHTGGFVHHIEIAVKQGGDYSIIVKYQDTVIGEKIMNVKIVSEEG